MAMSDYQTKMLELEERKVEAAEKQAEVLAEGNELMRALIQNQDAQAETLVEINNHLAIVAMSGTEE